MPNTQTSNASGIRYVRKYNFWSQSFLLGGISLLFPQWLIGSPFYRLGVEPGMEISFGGSVLQKSAVALSIFFVLVAVVLIPAMYHQVFLERPKVKRLIRFVCIFTFILLLATTLTITIAVPFNWSSLKRTNTELDVVVNLFNILGILLSWAAVYFAPRQLRCDLEILDQTELLPRT